jgi:uncharacterized protein
MADPKRVVVTGATGHIGRRLCPRLMERGYQVVVFSRDPGQARRSLPGVAEYVAWRPAESGAWASAIDGAHGVVHLAGASLFGKRWSAGYKREIIASREVGTRGLVSAMAQAQSRPQAFVSMSAVGYYGPRDDTKLDEGGPLGDDFLAHVCEIWEREARKAEDLGIRTVIVRSGVVIGGEGPMRLPIDLRGASLSRPGLILKTDEGALPLLVMPFRFFAGGPILPGTQWISWIHLDDIVGILTMALEDERVRGTVNAAAPEPQTNREFVRTIGRVMGRPAWLPKKAQELGYQFKYPTSEQALLQIMRS